MRTPDHLISPEIGVPCLVVMMICWSLGLIFLQLGETLAWQNLLCVKVALSVRCIYGFQSWSRYRSCTCSVKIISLRCPKRSTQKQRHSMIMVRIIYTEDTLGHNHCFVNDDAILDVDNAMVRQSTVRVESHMRKWIKHLSVLPPEGQALFARKKLAQATLSRKTNVQFSRIRLCLSSHLFLVIATLWRLVSLILYVGPFYPFYTLPCLACLFARGGFQCNHRRTLPLLLTSRPLSASISRQRARCMGISHSSYGTTQGSCSMRTYTPLLQVVRSHIYA